MANRLFQRTNSLLINDPVTLTAFCLSVVWVEISQDRQSAFTGYVERIMDEHDYKLSIVKDAELFIAVKA